MCDTCGCNVTPGNEHLVQGEGRLARTASGQEAVEVLQGLLSANDQQAAHNRYHFDSRGILAINLMSAPGSGKTALLEATADALGDRFRFAVIEGDLETENDADRIRARGIQAHQIATGTACHLDAHMVHDALHHMALDGVDVVFIENVGNLVCPASFDLGHHQNVTLLSATEGDDKPAKYPVMFRAADLLLLTKADLLEVLDDFDPARAEHCLRQLASEAPVLTASARRPEGLDGWLSWLEETLTAHRERVAAEATTRPTLDPAGHELHHHDHGHGHGHTHPHGHHHPESA